MQVENIAQKVGEILEREMPNLAPKLGIRLAILIAGEIGNLSTSITAQSLELADTFKHKVSGQIGNMAKLTLITSAEMQFLSPEFIKKAIFFRGEISFLAEDALQIVDALSQKHQAVVGLEAWVSKKSGMEIEVLNVSNYSSQYPNATIADWTDYVGYCASEARKFVVLESNYDPLVSFQLSWISQNGKSWENILNPEQN